MSKPKQKLRRFVLRLEVDRKARKAPAFKIVVDSAFPWAPDRKGLILVNLQQALWKLVEDVEREEAEVWKRKEGDGCQARGR